MPECHRKLHRNSYDTVNEQHLHLLPGQGPRESRSEFDWYLQDAIYMMSTGMHVLIDPNGNSARMTGRHMRTLHACN